MYIYFLYLEGAWLYQQKIMFSSPSPNFNLPLERIIFNSNLKIHFFFFFLNFLVFLLYSSSNDPGAMTNSREIITIISLDMSILPIMTRIALIMDRVKIMTLTIITTRTSLSKVINLVIIKVFVFLCLLSEFSAHFKIGFKRGEVYLCVFLRMES